MTAESSIALTMPSTRALPQCRRTLAAKLISVSSICRDRGRFMRRGGRPWLLMQTRSAVPFVPPAADRTVGRGAVAACSVRKPAKSSIRS